MNSRKDDDGHRGVRPAGTQQRGEPRFDVEVAALLPEWHGSNRNCVITDVSREGFRVELVRRDRRDLQPATGLHRGAMVPLAAVLPGSGQSVATETRVMHLKVKGNRLSMGLKLRDAAHPLTVELLRVLGLAQTHADAGTRNEDGPTTAAPLSGHAALVERFLANVRGELMELAGAPPANSGAFLGLVVVHNSEQTLRRLLGDSAPEDAASLRDGLQAELSALRLEDAVKELMLNAFDRLFVQPGPSTGH